VRAHALNGTEWRELPSDAPGSQHYPSPFDLLLPDRGNFLAMVSNLGSMRALRAA
jgi:hypothetical protein